MRPGGRSSTPLLRGLITDVDLRAAEVEWPGLQDFLFEIPAAERPPTFLQLVWLFENRQDRRQAA
jgi:hypothetical protein